MASKPSPTDSGEDPRGLTQRRIRHITAIQIRNLSSFPARDALASALNQPLEMPNITSLGNLSDDLDAMLSRKRSRRISTTSARTVKSHKSEDAIHEESPNQGSIGRASSSKVNFSVEKEGLSRQKSTTGTSRPYRARTSSMVSVSSRISALSNSHPSGGSGTPFSAFFPDNSQTALEKVIKSRLVETFVVVTIPHIKKKMESTTKAAPSTSPTSPRSKTTIGGCKAGENGDGRKALNRDSPKSIARRGTIAATRGLTKPLSSHVRSGSASSLRVNGDSKSGLSRSPVPPPKILQPVLAPSHSMYFSSIHRPSTNPSFALDIVSQVEEEADLGGGRLKIELWAKVSRYTRPEISRKGKEKETDTPDSNAQDWRVMDEWNVNLNSLLPLKDDPTTLPSNTLLITLSPPNRTFYLPSQLRTLRSETPSVGYTSDPESELRKVKQSEDHSSSQLLDIEPPPVPVAVSRRRVRKSRENGQSNHDGPDGVKTASYEELLRVAILHTCISEEEESLSTVVDRLNTMVEVDSMFAKRREMSERQARIEELRDNHKQLFQGTDRLRATISVKTQELKRRQHTLHLAGEQLHQDYDQELQIDEEISKERSNLSSLQARLVPTRTTILSTLSSIYPIELYSPPDLLFTILDVPLPIPVAPTDPAPPLSLPNYGKITEDVVSTSLGYAAQLVQLMAAYLGQGLVYPITCVGSRSLVRDGISTMVGPRVFPLFSRGVDAYRFEYGVYLLNKDIEMLMTERDLRALDMRHTLANLKNLLLTLTNGECAEIQRSSRPDSPLSFASEVEEEDGSTEKLDPQEPKTPTAESGRSSDSLNSSTPPASGSTTPTVSTTPTPTISDTSRKMAFLTFPPLSSFFRARQPSPVRSEGRSEAADPSQEDQVAEESEEVVGKGSEQDDDEDRNTIPGVARDPSTNCEGPKHLGEASDDTEKGEQGVNTAEGPMMSSPLPPAR